MEHGRNKKKPQSEVIRTPPVIREVLGSPAPEQLYLAPPDTAREREARAAEGSGPGHELRNVRIHADARAAQSAALLGAEAFTVGNDVVFGAGRYAPDTRAGKELLAHELTHVVQTGGTRSSPIGSNVALVQRRDIFESIGIFFGFTEGTFDDKELDEYLKKITAAEKIEDGYDSDNKARAIVRRWKTGQGPFALITARQKLLLIAEMRSGHFSKDDQECILDLFENSVSSDLTIMFGAGGINVDTLRAELGKDTLARFDGFLAQRFKGGAQAIAKGAVEPVGRPQSKAEVEARLRRARADLATLEKGVAALQSEFVSSKVAGAEKASTDKSITEAKKNARFDAQKRQIPENHAAMLGRVVGVVEGHESIKLLPRMEISYLALPEKEAAAQSSGDISRIVTKIEEVTTVKITSGYYNGITVSIKPVLTYRSRQAKPSSNAWQIHVRGPSDDDSSSASGGVIDLAPGHLQGDRVIVVAHEMLHLFGPGRIFGVLTDTYFSVTSGKPPKTSRAVGRTDARGRADLMGMIDPVFLKEWLDKKEITPEQFKHQTEGNPKLWEEDATVILNAMRVLRPTVKKPFDPESDDDPSAALEGEVAEKEAKLAKIRARRDKVAQDLDWLEGVEAIMRLKKEIAELEAQLGK